MCPAIVRGDRMIVRSHRPPSALSLAVVVEAALRFVVEASKDGLHIL